MVRIDQQAVMLAFEFRWLVTENTAEILVGGDDFSRRFELDDRQKPAEGFENAFGVAAKIRMKHHHSSFCAGAR
jgi:hypothetical protein